MRKLMAIFAHPDDEGAMGGTLAHYASDSEVMLVCATRGEVGEISDPALATRETLGAVRQQELEAACEALGIQHLAFLDFRDSGMVGTPENDDPRAFVQAEPAEAHKRIVKLIRSFKPDVVVTFEPFGWYGHPDHQAGSRWASEAYALAADPTAFADAGPAWQAQRLFHSVIKFSTFRAGLSEAVGAGFVSAEDLAFFDNIPQEMQAKTEAAVTHAIDVSAYFDQKQAATHAHKTQFGPDSFFVKVPADMLAKTMGQEHFIQVHPEPADNIGETPIDDLFAGLN